MSVLGSIVLDFVCMFKFKSDGPSDLNAVDHSAFLFSPAKGEKTFAH
jgi:hypothetical protein